MVLRIAVSLSAAFLRVRRASEVAALRVTDVCICESTGDVKISVRRQKDDQFGMGQIAYLVASPSLKGARPVRL